MPMARRWASGIDACVMSPGMLGKRLHSAEAFRECEHGERRQEPLRASDSAFDFDADHATGPFICSERRARAVDGS